jgi:hypothetical protein
MCSVVKILLLVSFFGTSTRLTCAIVEYFIVEFICLIIHIPLLFTCRQRCVERWKMPTVGNSLLRNGHGLRYLTCEGN